MKSLLVLCSFLWGAYAIGQHNRPNVLLIVADDLSYDSLGFVDGGVAPQVTPHIDRLAAESFVFEKTFASASVCQPSRQSMLSGLLPIHYGGGGFFPMAEGVPALPSLLGATGYVTGTIHKMHHTLPEAAFNWDFQNESLGLLDPDGVVGRDPVGVANGLRRFIGEADRRGRPFFMVVNSADPHRPFHGDPVSIGNWYWGYEPVTLPEPSRVYRPDEVRIPPALPDLPGIREDLAGYASSVRRLDDMVGACLSALADLNKVESTLVIFVSDNGMPLPFAKFDCYLNSNRSPLLMRWPEGIVEQRVESEHLISLMDITPTVLELAGVSVPEGLDGRSLVPFFEGAEPEDWRESVVFMRSEDIYYGDGIRNALKRNPDFKQYLESQGWVPRPDHREPGTYSRRKEMRSLYDGRFGYIYNDWYRPDGLEQGRLGVGVPYGDPSFNAMRAASQEEPEAAERVESYLLRDREELYDWSTDPGGWRNLAEEPAYAAVLKAMRQELALWMEENKDPLRESYRKAIE